MDHSSIEKYIRATNYLSAAQIYLKDNFLLERPLSFEHIKPRLLGHWGTCPGINIIYAHLNRQIHKRNKRILFILGGGHGFAALQANLFLEGTLEKYYGEATRNASGIEYLIRNFSWPYGFPSHSSPATPGVILEGGELGYALSTAYGAVLDRPDLVAAALIGDGEAETGPTAAAWHLNKFIDPVSNGTVLPILHLNGYKISGPTIFGRMSDSSLKSLFSGYGYQVFIVTAKDHEKIESVFDRCFDMIESLRENAQANRSGNMAKLPMIIFKSPKGLSGIKKLREKKIEGNNLSHQVVVPNAKTDKYELRALERWLSSYRFNELFDREKGFPEDILKLIPEGARCMGSALEHLGEGKKLILPEVETWSEDASSPGISGSSSMRRAGLYLNDVFKLNSENLNFRLFSPDETYSNKLDKVFESTKRAFLLPRKKWDMDISPTGRVIEMLSEHSLQGLLQGYVLTGRHGIFASYEAFIQIVSSMVDQYAKFLKVASQIPWRKNIPSLNYILTSSGWRQEHNGFSHQNPGFLDTILRKHGTYSRVYFPPDGNATLAVLDRCLRSTNGINVIVAGKTQEPRWLTPELAQKELETGIMTWDFASRSNPDIIVSAIGDYLTKEALAAIDIVRKAAPSIRMRFVNIIELSSLGIKEGIQSKKELDAYFTSDVPVIFNFHGYPGTLKQILFDWETPKERFSVHGYIENGSTTTPFDMHVRNKTDRYTLASEIISKMKVAHKVDADVAERLLSKWSGVLENHRAYISKFGVDPEEIAEWTWTNTR